MTYVLLLNTKGDIFNNELVIIFQIMKGGQEIKGGFKDEKSTIKMVCRTSALLKSYD